MSLFPSRVLLRFGASLSLQWGEKEETGWGKCLCVWERGDDKHWVRTRDRRLLIGRGVGRILLLLVSHYYLSFLCRVTRLPMQRKNGTWGKILALKNRSAIFLHFFAISWRGGQSAAGCCMVCWFQIRGYLPMCCPVYPKDTKITKKA